MAGMKLLYGLRGQRIGEASHPGPPDDPEFDHLFGDSENEADNNLVYYDIVDEMFADNDDTVPPSDGDMPPPETHIVPDIDIIDTQAEATPIGNVVAETPENIVNEHDIADERLPDGPRHRIGGRDVIGLTLQQALDSLSPVILHDEFCLRVPTVQYNW